MTDRKPDASESKGLSHVLALLENLKSTGVGTVIYDQISRILDEYDTVQNKIDRAYSLLLHLLLDSYAVNPTSDHVTQVNARLIRLYMPRQPHAPEEKVTESVSPDVHTKKEDALARRKERDVARPSDSTSYDSSVGQDRPAAGAEEGADTTRPMEEHDADRARENGAPLVERRVNSAYRLHLDRKRNEILKLQEMLSKNAAAAITQNREFGALLQIELVALEQAEGVQEVENLRQILIGAIEELIQGQRSLDVKLHKTSDYLKLIRSDSQRLHDELNKVRLLSLTDEYTGLPNRRAFMRRLRDEIGRAQRYGLPLALALIDLDEFKSINDLYGHAAGDEVLRCYATNVLSVLRHHDMVARYGGEEFAVLLPNTVESGAVSAIYKVKKRAQQAHCELNGNTLTMPTFSTGITMYVPGETHISLIDRADRALYRAKHLGRDRIEVILASDAQGRASVAGDTTPGTEEVGQRREQLPRTSGATDAGDADRGRADQDVSEDNSIHP